MKMCACLALWVRVRGGERPLRALFWHFFLLVLSRVIGCTTFGQLALRRRLMLFFFHHKYRTHGLIQGYRDPRPVCLLNGSVCYLPCCSRGRPVGFPAVRLLPHTAAHPWPVLGELFCRFFPHRTTSACVNPLATSPRKCSGTNDSTWKCS